MKNFIVTFIIALAIIFTFSDMTLADTNTPEFVPQEGYDFYQYESDNGSISIMWKSSPSIKLQLLSTNTMFFSNKTSENLALYRYQYNSVRKTWIIDTDFNLSVPINSTSSYGEIINSFKYSSVDIYNQQGTTVVFQKTPLLEKVVGESLRKFPITMVGMMKVLALCGVGCLASLMGLRLFGKVFRIFRA